MTNVPKTSERCYRELFETTQDGILLIDSKTGIIVDVNKSLIRLSGYSRKDFFEKHIWELTIFKDIVASKGHFAKWRNKQHVQFEDVELKTKNGEKIAIDFTANAYKTEGAAFMQCSIHDVTERKQAEEGVTNSEAQLRLIFDHAIDGILIADQETKRFVMANPALCQLLGYSEKEILKLEVNDIHPKKQLPMVLDQFKKQAQGKIKIAKDIPCQRKDGTIIYSDVAASPIKIGKRMFLVGFFRDTSKRKETEDALQKSEKRYHDIFETSKDALMLLDDKHFFDCNRATLEMFGYKTVEEFCKKHPGQVSPPLQPDGTPSIKLANKRIADTFKKGSNRFEWAHRRKDGKDFPAFVLLVPFELEGKKVLQATVRNITEDKRMEQELGINLHSLECMDLVSQAIQKTSNIEEMTNNVLKVVLKIFDCDRAWLFYPCVPDAPFFRVPMEVTKPEYPGAKILNVDLPMPTDMAQNLRELLETDEPVTYTIGTEKPINKMTAKKFGVKSQMMIALYPKSGQAWAFGIHQCSYPRFWTPEEKRLMKEISLRLTDALSSLLAHKNLQENERKLKDAQRLAHIGNWTLELSTNKLSWSDEIYRIFEIPPKKSGTSYKAFLKIVHPDDRDFVNKAYTDSVKDKTPYEILHRLLMKDGRIKYVTECCETSYAPDGSPIASVGTVQDITALKEAEGLLKESKDQAEAILSSIGDGVVACDKNGKIILFNHIASELSGVAIEKAMGQHYKKILQFAKETTGKVGKDFIGEAIAEGHVTFMVNHTVIINKNGERTPVTNSASPILNKSGAISGCVVTFRDVTEAQKMDKAKTEFVSLASHQLRTPLTSIKWITEMFLNGDIGPITATQKDSLKIVNKASQRMVALIRALLNVSRLELGTFSITTEPLEISKVVDDTVVDFNMQIKDKKIKIIKKYSSKLPTTTSDPILLKIIIQNLISNAINYSTPETSLTIKIGKDKNNFLLTVSDHGIGIPKKDQSKVFTKLFRASNAQLFQTDGTGLGLYLTKSIIDSVGGKIWFDSEANKGSSFHVQLPLKGMTPRKGAKPLETGSAFFR